MKIYRVPAVLLVLVILLCSLSPIHAQDDTITISNKEDFIQFSKNCSLDTWSQGKTVNLTCDIDMSDTDFSSVPTFGGTFNGNGYTISGISVSRSGSYLGLFRYIQEGGKVANLHVKAALNPGGSKSHIGGIAGENGGVIEQCSFDGSVKGENVVGGIAGNNTWSGQIISCAVFGSVIGENCTGGIAGKNDGLISDCANYAEINTIYEEKKNGITDINTDAGAILESYRESEEESEEESVLGHTDTGGIVGYTTGVVQGCVNDSVVGYQHVGYNVGGIAGRQLGYLLGCDNSGMIQGRKDVGGIVGQAEPYTILSTSEDVLRDVREEINNLNTMTDNLITEVDNQSDNASQHISEIIKHTQSARENAEVLVNESTNFINDNLSEINTRTAILSNTINKFESVFDKLESSANNMQSAFSDTSAALDSIEVYAPDLTDEMEDIKSAVDEIARSESSISNANSKIKRAAGDLEEAVIVRDQIKVQNALSDISAAVTEIKNSMQSIKTSLETIENILNSKPDEFSQIFGNAETILQSILAIKQGYETSISSLETILVSLVVLGENVNVDFDALQWFSRDIGQATNYLSEAARNITGGLTSLSEALGDTQSELQDYMDDMSGQINSSKEQLSTATTSLSYAADDMKSAFDDIGKIIDDFSNEKTAEFVKLSDDFKNAGDNLFNSISGISDEISALHNTISDGKNKFADNLRSVSSQLNLVMNLIVGEFEELQSSEYELSDIFVDVSDEDIENSLQGKVAECVNYGIVQSDRNTGGIAGSMSIEYTKDPEDEIPRPNTLHFTYMANAILESCVNNGEISTKKDCAGGIAGFAELGTVFKCENYGNVNISNGNYAGGIVGRSDAAIRKCYAKSRVEGNDFIGGIAGKAEILSACCSVSSVFGEERVGAVLGMCDSRTNLRENYFLDNGIGAVDGISYQDSAEPVTFDELVGVYDIPKRMISFTVTFIADGEVVETQDIEYGSPTARINYPEIPPKDGYFGNWSPVEGDTITENLEIQCIYTPYITILSSAEKDENGKLALALAEGEFTDKSELHITESEVKPPSSANGDVEVFDISLINTDITDNEPVRVRVINKDHDSVNAWILKDDNWEQVRVTPRGKYVILETAGASSTICLQYTKMGFGKGLPAIAAFIILGIAAFVIVKKFKLKEAK